MGGSRTEQNVVRIHEAYQVKDVQSGNVSSVWLTNVKKKKPARLKNGQKISRDSSARKTYTYALEKALNILSLGNWKENETPLHTCWTGHSPECWWHKTPARTWSSSNSHPLSVGMGDSAATLEDGVPFLTERPSNHTPWYSSTGIEYYVQIKTCTQTNIAALFTTDKTWKQSRCPSVGE